MNRYARTMAATCAGEPPAATSMKSPTWIVGGIFLVAALDTVVINVLLGPMGDAIGGPTGYCWIASAFMLAVAVGARPAGLLFDNFGGRNVLLGSAALVMVGCALAAAVSRLGEEIVARILQGLGTAGISTACVALLGAPDSARLRRRAQALLGVLYGVAAVFGPAVAVWLTNAFGWRSVFVAMALLGGLAVVIAASIPRSPRQPARSLDATQIAMVAALMTLALMLCGPARSSTEIVLGLLLALAMTCGTIRFAGGSTRAAANSSGMVRLRGAAAILFLSSACLYGVVSVLAVILHRAGISIGGVGLAVGATGAGFVAGSVISGALTTRLGYTGCLALCAAVMACALGGVAIELPSPHPARLAALLLAFGAGFGVQNSTVLLLAQDVPLAGATGQAIAAAHLARNLGGACGINIFAGLIAKTSLGQPALQDAAMLFAGAGGALAVATPIGLALLWQPPRPGAHPRHSESRR